ncbi:hypothetical protein SAMN04487967_3340 [Natronorubrum sediminis]|uniref:Calcium-binding protein n=2 Tax=Natronorubrum sediminis TaxID=640943 RepID=A0A1H6G3R0_9EURY|nr:hypothetical protein SAMN04487967_3340 [Natronorubrum sediminis]
MAKSALATGALALGTAGFGTATVGAQESDRVAVFANNYYPGADFSVIAVLETSTTVNILQDDDETVDEISQPDEWGGHIIRYDIGEEAGITTFLFADGQQLSAGDTGTISEDASMLSPDLNLLSTSLDDAAEPDDDVDDDDDLEDDDLDDDDLDDDDDFEDDVDDDDDFDNDVDDENDDDVIGNGGN